jgi:hypothetical protein
MAWLRPYHERGIYGFRHRSRMLTASVNVKDFNCFGYSGPTTWTWRAYYTSEQSTSVLTITAVGRPLMGPDGAWCTMHHSLMQATNPGAAPNPVMALPEGALRVSIIRASWRLVSMVGFSRRCTGSMVICNCDETPREATACRTFRRSPPARSRLCAVIPVLSAGAGQGCSRSQR